MNLTIKDFIFFLRVLEHESPDINIIENLKVKELVDSVNELKFYLIRKGAINE